MPVARASLKLRLRRAGLGDTERVADVWLRSREASVPAIPPAVHSEVEVRDWVANVVLPTKEVWVVDVGEPVAMMVLDDGWIDQIYVDPSWMGRGIGSALLDAAKARCPEGLDLWTFQANVDARRFYQRHGFVAAQMTDGDNEERAPDVRYRWEGTAPIGMVEPE